MNRKLFLKLFRGQSQSAVYCEIHVSVLWGNVFVKQSSEFDKQEGFSSEKCVVDYTKMRFTVD